MAHSYLMNTYLRYDVCFTHGAGMRLFDTHGKAYLDAIAGIATCSLGHAHPAVSQAISTQAGKLIHCSNLYRIDEQEALAAKLCQIAGMDKAFLCNSGAEANEAAIKLARLHATKHEIEQPQIITLHHSFHGRTLTTLSASGNSKIQQGFEPLVPGFLYAAIDDIAAIKQLIAEHHVVAILLEPTQGEGGVRLLSAPYLQAVAALCQQHNILLMFDEIQTGNARTGSYFAYQGMDIAPDVVTTAKGLGNGFPIGACLARGPAAELFQPGNHGSTFGGNPLACATALAVVNTICEQKLADNAAHIGAYLLAEFNKRLAQAEHVVDIRGQGLMLGIELNHACGHLVQQALAKGLLINVTAHNVVRLLPALIINRQEADELLDILCPLIATSQAAVA